MAGKGLRRFQIVFPNGEKGERVQDHREAAGAQWSYEPNGVRKLLVFRRIFQAVMFRTSVFEAGRPVSEQQGRLS
jgi:hypothetical protein